MIGMWAQGRFAVECARRARCPTPDGAWVFHESQGCVSASSRMAGQTKIRVWNRAGTLVWSSYTGGGIRRAGRSALSVAKVPMGWGL
jgi:hypothetical protein